MSYFKIDYRNYYMYMQIFDAKTTNFTLLKNYSVQAVNFH